MSAGQLGPFPANLTSPGFQTIGAVQKGSTAFGYLGPFPAGLTTGKMHIGAVQTNPNNAWVNNFSDSVTASDSMSATVNYLETFSDSVTASDTQGAILTGNAAFSDTVIASDSITSSLAANAAFFDTATASDSFGAAMAGSNTFSDSATLADSFVGGIGYTFTFSDNVTVADAIAATLQAAYSFSDGITASDSVVGGIGYNDVFSDAVTASDSFTATVSPQPNIVLAGTIDYNNPYCIPNQPLLNLDFGVILGDDNFIRVNTPNILTGGNLAIIAANVTFYAPNTNSAPVVTKTGTIGGGYFLFSLASTDVSSLAPGLYTWLAIVTLADGSHHILNVGDTNLTTGVMTLVNRPY